MQLELRHDMQMRAAARAHFLYSFPLGPIPFEEAERRRTPAYLRSVEAAQEESAEIMDLVTACRQMELL